MSPCSCAWNPPGTHEVKVEISPSAAWLHVLRLLLFFCRRAEDRPPSQRWPTNVCWQHRDKCGIFRLHPQHSQKHVYLHEKPVPPALSAESFITGGHFRRYQMCQTFTLITPSDGSPGFNGSNLSVPRRPPKAQTITMGGEEDDEEGMNKISFKKSS